MRHNPLIIIHHFSGIATVMSIFRVLFSFLNLIYFSKYTSRLLPVIITQDSERSFQFNTGQDIIVLWIASNGKILLFFTNILYCYL